MYGVGLCRRGRSHYFWIRLLNCGRRTRSSRGLLDNSMDTIIHSDTFSVARRLDELGLSHDVLVNAVAAGYQARSNCMDVDPKMFRGLTMWAVTTRHLRLRLLPNWRQKDDANLSLIVSPDERIAIGVATGDEGTGIPDLIPSTKSSKGPRTIDAVATNNRQLELEFTFPDGWTPSFPSVTKHGDCATWLLLIHCDASSVRAELSHPLSFDDYKRVNGWRERILLPSINIEPLDEIELDDDTLPIDVPVRRKA